MIWTALLFAASPAAAQAADEAARDAKPAAEGSVAADDDAVAAALTERVRAHRLDADVAFEVRGGQVTLIGRVPDAATRNEIVLEARAIDGVRHVEDQLQVRDATGSQRGAFVVPDLVVSAPDPAAPDEEEQRQMRSDLMIALLNSPLIDPSGINVTFEDGKLELNGYVRTTSEKRTAERIAKRFVTHEVGVENHLRVVDGN